MVLVHNAVDDKKQAGGRIRDREISGGLVRHKAFSQIESRARARGEGGG